MAQRAVSSANPIRHYWMQPCWPLLHGTDPNVYFSGRRAAGAREWREGQSLRTAGGTSKMLAQGFQAGLPSHRLARFAGSSHPARRRRQRTLASSGSSFGESSSGTTGLEGGWAGASCGGFRILIYSLRLFGLQSPGECGDVQGVAHQAVDDLSQKHSRELKKAKR
jgi:hypothetical protein